MAAPHPRMHGLTHVTGGPDPIPGLPPTAAAGSSFPTAIAEISEAHPGNLLGYWRLGEATAPFADSSGLSPSRPGTLNTPSGSPPLMSLHITGALPTADDDGAVEFTGTTGADQQSIVIADTTPFRFNFGGDITVCCWVKPHASSSTFDGAAISNTSNPAPFPQPTDGFRLAVSWPNRTPRMDNYFRAAIPDISLVGAPLPADEWAFIVGTNDFTGGTGFKLYVNGSLVASNATVHGSTTGANNGLRLGIGYRFPGSSSFIDAFDGGLDEVSIWDVALTGIEVGTLFSAGLGAGAAADKVLTAVGDGTSSWEYPTVKLDGTRYDEILTGTNLASTDNTDGTVTLDASGGGGAVASDTIWDAKGDLAVATAADTASKLAVGTDGQVLTADSTQTTGVKWAVAAGGGASPSDVASWMPLTTVVGGVPDLVWDADDNLISTYTTF